MLGDIFFSANSNQSLDKLNPEEVKYWNRMILSNLKIGVEIECCYERGYHDSGEIQRSLINSLKPTENYGMFGKCGVISVKGDGSLANGVELCTTGRRIGFLDLYEQYRFIISKMMAHRPIVNGRAGLHNHILMDHDNDGGCCLEKPFPAIVFKNFVQLIRRYMPELVWITSTIKSNCGEITRFNKFCQQETLMTLDSLHTVREICRNISGNDRYQFLNCRPMETSDSTITRFHVELRFPDASIYPAQIAAQNVLYTAMLLKAVELSQFGIIATGNQEEWSETKELINKLRNTNTSQGERCSRALSGTEQDVIKERAIEFVKFMKPSIGKIDPKVYYILADLANEPISIKRVTRTDQFINDYYNQSINQMYSVPLEDCADLSKAITLQKFKGYRNESEWVTAVASNLGISIPTFQNQFTRLKSVNKLEFDKELGLVHFK